MDNFIEASIDYMFYNGGFNLLVGDQRFEFRIRPNDVLEVTSITNHIKKVFSKDTDVYQFFAFLIFCDLYSARQRCNMTVCKDRNLSINNLKVLNRVYEIYKTMLSLSDKEILDSVSDDDPGCIDRVMLEKAYENDLHDGSNLKFDLIRVRIEKYARDFMRRYVYWDNLYDELLTTEEYDPLHEYALIKMEEARNNINANHPHYFTQEDIWHILFERSTVLEESLNVGYKGGIEQKHHIMDALFTLYNKKVDIMDIIEIMKNAFHIAISEERDTIIVEDFIEAIELSYLPDDIIDEIKNILKKENPQNNKIVFIKPIK